MRALVVYESMYGNTHAVAVGIAAGLRATHEVTVVPVSRADRELAAAADLIVVGGPTHIHGMPSVASRRAAAETAHKPGSELILDPDADGPGLRAWLEGLSAPHALGAAFDTRLNALPVLTGRASSKISRLLSNRGCQPLAPQESFLVTKQNKLVDGEIARACSWGAMLGETALLAYAAGKR